jgi:hypothetical protein
VAWDLRAAVKAIICSAGGPHALLRWQVQYCNAVHLGSLSKCRTCYETSITNLDGELPNSGYRLVSAPCCGPLDSLEFQVSLRYVSST